MSIRANRTLRSLLLVPALALIVFVVVVPGVQALLILLFASDGAGPLENLKVFADPAFGDALRNTLVLMVVLLPVQALVAVALARLIAARFRGATFLRYLVVLPLAVSDLAAGLLWLSFFTDRGYLSSALQSAGLIAQPMAWLGFDSYGGMLAAIVVAETWRTTGVLLLPILARLRLSTTGLSWSVFRSSLWPALLLRAILGLQTFAVVVALVGRNLPVVAGEAYTQLVTNRDQQLAAACAVAILAIATLAGVVYLRLASTRVSVGR